MKTKPKNFKAWKNGRERFNSEPTYANVQEQIELILQEANAYGVRVEVKTYAEQLITEGGDKLTSYQNAFNMCTRNRGRI